VVSAGAQVKLSKPIGRCRRLRNAHTKHAPGKMTEADDLVASGMMSELKVDESFGGACRPPPAPGPPSRVRLNLNFFEGAQSTGLHSLAPAAQLEDLRDTSLTLELSLSTFGPHPRVNLGGVGDNVS